MSVCSYIATVEDMLGFIDKLELIIFNKGSYSPTIIIVTTQTMHEMKAAFVD